MESTELKDKSVIVTGGTTGIGRALCKHLVAAGANVLLFGRHEPELQDALNDIGTDGKDGKGKVIGMTADQTVYEDVLKVFARADEELGGLDVLVNNAAQPASNVSKDDVQTLKYVVDTNLVGYMVCSKLALERMQAQGKGHIVNIGSMSAEGQDPNNTYVATKAGVRGFAKSLGKEANKAGIRVTTIEPGLVGTDMTIEDKPEQEQWQRDGKMLKAEDIAGCVVYALSQPERCNVEFVQIRPVHEAG